MKTVAFSSSLGGVGQTTLVYHLAWMFADHGIATLAVDLNPQANLTAMFLDDTRLESLWPDGDHPDTVLGGIRPLMRGTGDIASPHVERITANLGLLAGDPGLSACEDALSGAWPRCHNREEYGFRATTAFYRLIRAAAADSYPLVLIDVAAGLGAMNRSALIASDQVCIPLAPDLFSIQGLKILGPTLRKWAASWDDLSGKAHAGLSLPTGGMQPIGYILMQLEAFRGQLVAPYRHWMDRIPGVYREAVLGETGQAPTSVADAPYCLSLLKHYRSLMPMAMEARKPIFFLKSADGAIGAHIEAVGSCYQDFQHLASRIAAKADIPFA